jgi:hypothetical protein
MKEDWEKLHKFRKSEHNCSFCKHCEVTEKTPWDFKYACLEMRKAGVGASTKASYDCDLWEHHSNV